MNRPLMIVLSVCLLGCGSGAESVHELKGNRVLSTTRAEVLAKYAGTAIDSMGAESIGWNSPTEKDSGNPLTIAEFPVRAIYFTFDEDVLVSMSAILDSGKEPGSVNERLIRAFSGKYGSPTKDGESDTWTLKDSVLSVTLSIVTVGSRTHAEKWKSEGEAKDREKAKKVQSDL